MRLSEEIRLGSLLVQEPKANDITRCAIGMANLCSGYVASEPHEFDAMLLIVQRHRWLNANKIPCPVCKGDLRGSEVVWHPFDQHIMMERKLTIEQLVDWIRSVEPPDPSELLKEVDDAVGEHPEHEDVKPMDIYERWERSAPERQG